VKVSIIDDSFTGWTGHNAGYNFSICDELSRRSIDYQVFAHQSVREFQSSYPNVLPTFKQNTHTASFRSRFLPNWVNRILKLAVVNYRHFIDLITKVSSSVNDRDIILIAVESRYTSFAYGLWLFILFLRKVRVTAVFVVHNVPSNILKWEMRFLRILAVGHHVVLTAHTQAIAGLCEEATGQRCYLLPLPFKNNQREPEKKREPLPSGSVSFTYLGVASFAKGFDIVVEAIGGIEDMLESGEIELAIQSNAYQESEETNKLQEALISQTRKTPAIDVMKGPLSAEQYYLEMERADVILIPNRGEFYEHALSGVFTESLARGKPVIVSEDTYMAKELKQHGGGMTFLSGSATALAGAIRAATAGIAELREKALTARIAWLDRHNPERYVDALLEISNH